MTPAPIRGRVLRTPAAAFRQRRRRASPPWPPATNGGVERTLQAKGSGHSLAIATASASSKPTPSAASRQSRKGAPPACQNSGHPLPCDDQRPSKLSSRRQAPHRRRQPATPPRRANLPPTRAAARHQQRRRAKPPCELQKALATHAGGKRHPRPKQHSRAENASTCPARARAGRYPAKEHQTGTHADSINHLLANPSWCLLPNVTARAAPPPMTAATRRQSRRTEKHPC